MWSVLWAAMRTVNSPSRRRSALALSRRAFPHRREVPLAGKRMRLPVIPVNCREFRKGERPRGGRRGVRDRVPPERPVAPPVNQTWEASRTFTVAGSLPEGLRRSGARPCPRSRTGPKCYSDGANVEVLARYEGWRASTGARRRPGEFQASVGVTGGLDRSRHYTNGQVARRPLTRIRQFISTLPAP